MPKDEKVSTGSACSAVIYDIAKLMGVAGVSRMTDSKQCLINYTKGYYIKNTTADMFQGLLSDAAQEAGGGAYKDKEGNIVGITDETDFTKLLPILRRKADLLIAEADLSTVIEKVRVYAASCLNCADPVIEGKILNRIVPPQKTRGK